MKKILLNIIILLTCTFALSGNAASKNKETYEYLDLFGQIFDRVRSGYVEEVTDEELIEKAIDGMLTGLDPHSGYMNEEVWQEMQTDTKGKFGGLGIEITMEEGFVKVISPIEDTPAYEAGVKAGDYIIQIDETPVFGLSLNEAVDLMRGKKGSPIIITISREGVDPFEIKIIRDIIKIQSVKSDIFNDIGYLRITSFTEQTESGLIKSIKKIKEDLNNKEIGYILDLRSNPGGLLKQAVKVTDIFLERGEIVSTRGRKKIDMQRYQAKSGDLIDKKPLIVIINGGSASASEIVAAALQDHGRAIVVGGKMTHGKGTVQQILPLNRSFIANLDKDSGQLKFTISKFYRINGATTQRDGVKPDIILPSVFDYLGMSEAELPRALESDEIEKAKYKSLDRVEAFFTSLRKASTKRINGDQDYKYIREDITRAKKQKEDRSVSLNESERRQERADNKTRIEARNKERADRAAQSEKYFEIDVKLAEAGKPLKKLDPPKPKKQNPDPNAIPEDDSSTFRFDPELRETLQILSDFVKLNSKLISQIKKN